MTQEKVIPKEKERQNNRLWWLLLLLLLLLLLAVLCVQQDFVQSLLANGQGQAAALEQQAPAIQAEPQAANTATATLLPTMTSAATLTLSPTATEANPLACKGILGISFLDSISMRIQLDFPGLPSGEYKATINNSEVQCTTYEDYPERLFCDGPKPAEGSLASISVLDENGETICMESFHVPISPTATPKDVRVDNPDGGDSCQEPAGGCNSGACEVWSSSACGCVLDPSCVN
ncbi:MAG: hypothetical protein DWQ07_08515 [Chloroflexi bacterium]|nr:MAG: hypothetical protein DWQ07_08515 [Chloroflexota bacterium]MBL1193245.1 hypothetical protein [Chloroflexota bacterium]NOH10540.1 hypothetical protein [Chloroflexota bacterium]